MITLKRISQDVCNLLLELNFIDPTNTYDYDELETLLIKLIKDADENC